MEKYSDKQNVENKGKISNKRSRSIKNTNLGGEKNKILEGNVGDQVIRRIVNSGHLVLDASYVELPEYFSTGYKQDLLYSDELKKAFLTFSKFTRICYKT